MPDATYGVTFSAGGISIQSSKKRTADGQIGVQATLPVGSAGTLSTRIDDNTGILTVGSGHGITDADTVDVYWSGGRRYGVDVTATTATTISIDLGAGDNLPAQSTPIVVTKQVQINIAIDGDELEILGLQLFYASESSTAVGHATFKDSGAAVIKEHDLNANVAVVYDITGGATNVFTGNPITAVYASNGSSSEVATLKIGGVVDATP